MKTLAQLAVPIVAAVLISGCASGNYQKGAATGAGLQASADKVGQASDKINVTMASLNDLVNQPGDLVAQFKKFSADVDGLESSAKDVESKVSSMRGQGNEYFKAWDEQMAQIHNEDIKARSASRKAEMQAKFTEIKRSYVEAEDAFKPFMADLRDIRAALATDLTPGGVSAIKGAADKANQHAVPLRESLNKLATQFRELGVAMSSAAPQPAPTQ